MPSKIAGALVRYRVMAWATGVVLATFSVLLAVRWAQGSPPWSEAAKPAWYVVGWQVHGWLYVLYVAAALDLAFRLRWALGRSLLVALAGTVPFMSFVAEHVVTQNVRARYADAQDPVLHRAG